MCGVAPKVHLTTIGLSVCVTATVMHVTVTDGGDGAEVVGRTDQAFGYGAETRLLFPALVRAAAYGCQCAYFPGRGLVASEIASRGRRLRTWIVALLVGTARLCWWPGPRAWITHPSMLIVRINDAVGFGALLHQGR